MRKKLLFLLVTFLIEVVVFAQQLPQFSQRMMDETVYNPAVTGTSDFSAVKLHHRSQWIGFSNAPSTQSISYDGIINNKMGAGGYVLNDVTGPTRRFGINLAYSYKVKLKNFLLSFGLSTTILQTGIDGTKIDLYQNGDPIIAEGLSDKAWKPDAGFGMYLYNKKFYAGFSIQQLFQSRFRIDGIEGLNAEMPLVRHYFLSSGYKIVLNDYWMLEPSILFSGTIGTPAAVDFSAKAMFRNRFITGFSFRVNDAVVFLAGIKIKEIFTLAYCYDVVVSKLRKYNSGSHELMLVFDVFGSADNKEEDSSSFK